MKFTEKKKSYFPTFLSIFESWFNSNGPRLSTASQPNNPGFPAWWRRHPWDLYQQLGSCTNNSNFQENFPPWFPMDSPKIMENEYILLINMYVSLWITCVLKEVLFYHKFIHTCIHCLFSDKSRHWFHIWVLQDGKYKLFVEIMQDCWSTKKLSKLGSQKLYLHENL